MQKIYVVEADHGLVKVGVSGNPRKRLATLRTGSAHRLSLAFAADCEGASAETLERHVHSLLAARRKAGEWFDVGRAEAVEAIRIEAGRIGCELAPIALIASVAENHPWQQRMRTAGLSQRVLSRMLGRPEITVSKQLRGHFGGVVPRHLTAVIIAWEMMTPEQREAWVKATDDPDAGPDA